MNIYWLSAVAIVSLTLIVLAQIVFQRHLVNRLVLRRSERPIPPPTPPPPPKPGDDTAVIWPAREEET